LLIFIAEAVSASHQSYHQFVENQRSLASRFDPRVPPSNLRSEVNSRPIESRPRGWSYDTTRNGRGGRVNGWFNGNPNHNNGRRWIPATARASPPRQLGPTEPIYVLTSENSSSQNPGISSSQRVVSEPVNPRNSIPHTSQRAFSDLPAGRGTIKDESVPGRSAGRRASINDVNAPSNYFVENMLSSQKSPSRAETSGHSTPRVTLINDARVLEAIEKQDGQGLVNQPPESRHAPTPVSKVQGFEEPHLVTYGNGGPTHTYFYAGTPRKIIKAEQGPRTVYVGHASYEFFRDHTMKEMLSECGAVDNISYLVESGHAFAA
jgi:hypothetical protein